ncbi:NAD-dependent epimerase/dehydratase family protein [Taklimakanibacter lacteus]|uniref:NAD-dependent epimerase/dehydratase family protein n=1 Tax=Taklimakanibacter lacteus TaxID=2268456 RepID=UPI000E6620C8
MRFLVTGATGKVGQTFIARVLAHPLFAQARITALCHNRTVAPHERVDIIRGSIADSAVLARAMDGVTHVFHLATVKEDPAQVIDVSIKGLFLLLEAARTSRTLRQLVLVGGDAAVGHCFVDYPEPVTETSPRRAYPGVYAFSKVLEEEMVEQYRHQYGLNGTILRAPWIMEKDDFRYALAFGTDQFGGPLWDELMPPEENLRHAAENRAPLLLDINNRPLKRNFVHVEDLVSAMTIVVDNDAARGQLFNVAMTDPVDYGEAAAILRETRGMQPVEIRSRFHSNALSNAKARAVLGWQPLFDLRALIEAAFTYRRAADDPRKIWYVG